MQQSARACCSKGSLETDSSALSVLTASLVLLELTADALPPQWTALPACLPQAVGFSLAAVLFDTACNGCWGQRVPQLNSFQANPFSAIDVLTVTGAALCRTPLTTTATLSMRARARDFAADRPRDGQTEPLCIGPV
jgi:hypothetical protein